MRTSHANTYIYEWNVQFDIDGLSIYRHSDKSAYLIIIFLISQPKHMLWVLKTIE